MKYINELKGILTTNLGWNKARIDCFAKMLLSLFKARTVNLAELACSFSSQNKLLSRYRRLQRFFHEFEIDLSKVAEFVFKLFELGDKVYLTMDRTNWKLGKIHINILMLGIVYKGVAIPLYWKLLNTGGNSDTSDRIEVLSRFIKSFGKDRIEGVLADREFIGKHWFAYLINEDIGFYIRIRNNTITTNSRGLAVDIDSLFYGVKWCENRIIKGRRKVYGHQLYLSGSRHDTDGELLIVATNRSPDNALEIYLKRWEIESLFSCFKSRGFRFEETRMVNPVRISRLLVLLTIGFCWAHKVGEWQNEEVPIKIKKHGRKTISIFRYGLNFIRDKLFNLCSNTRSLIRCFKFLIPENYCLFYVRGSL